MYKSILFFLIIIFSCEQLPESHLEQQALLPIVKNVVPTGKHFKLNRPITLSYDEKDSLLHPVAAVLEERWEKTTGYKFSDKWTMQRIAFKRIEGLAQEEYILSITSKSIQLEASTNEGFFRAIMTLEQLLLLATQQVDATTTSSLPTGVIKDHPRFAYRGTMLDVSRHFFSVEDLKRHIDLLALYKINFLHLHLSDDQGWRIEIKQWPKLTEIGGSTEVGGGEGGFYTQAEYKEIVAYAAKHFITIVPEIDLPGHTNAALASYPALNCDGIAPPLYTGTDVGFSSLCVNKEITFKFMEEVIAEIAAITPGPYFHIGGDESHSTKKEDYITFIDAAQAMVKANNKAAIGWDEIQSTELFPKTVAHFWRNKANAKNAIAQGNKLLMSPASRAYLDMKYNDSTSLGLNWAGNISVKHAYVWDPATLVDGIGEENIIGIEAPLWSETIEDYDDLAYLAFPRLLGYAEIGWANTDQRQWDNYQARLIQHGKILKSKGVNFYRSTQVLWDE
ncbi:MAG: family 20 glycosylhydrolase [Flavobacteriaceae bacterium]